MKIRENSTEPNELEAQKYSKSNSQMTKYAQSHVFLNLQAQTCLSVVKDSCEQSGVNTIESLQGFHPLYIGEFWPPFIRAMLFQLS